MRERELDGQDEAHARAAEMCATCPLAGLDVGTLEQALLLHAGEFIAEPESFGSRRSVAENIAAIYDRLWQQRVLTETP